MMMAKSGRHSVGKYAYSNARIKARKARILTKDFMLQLSSAPDLGAAILLLMQTDYRPELEEYGGTKIKADMIDFALSKNMATRIGMLSQIAPRDDKTLVALITGLWEINNMKIAIEAKERGYSFDKISKYVIDYGRYGRAGIETAMSQPTVEEVIFSLSHNSKYKTIIADALREYKSTGSIFAASLALDKGYYKMLGTILDEVRRRDAGSAELLRNEIDITNLTTLIRSKRRNTPTKYVEGLLMDYGTLRKQNLLQEYDRAKDLAELVKSVKLFDLNGALELYEKTKQLLMFEMHMRNELFKKARHLLSSSVLSFGTIVSYAYMKETEIFTLREILKTKEYDIVGSEAAALLNA
jgi:vacuolar-type H+-ATPase subunit C/Vma6